MQKYIDEDWIIQKLSNWRKRIADTYGENDEYAKCLDEVMLMIDAAPPTDVMPTEVIKKFMRDFLEAVDEDGMVNNRSE